MFGRIDIQRSHVRSHPALFYFPALIIGGMCTLGGMAWLYEKTRKKIEHPRLGKLTYYDDSWVGLIPHFKANEPAVRFELPGTRKGLEADSVERFEAIWARAPELIESLRPHAMQDLEDAHDAVIGSSTEKETRAVIERVASSGASGLDADWKLASVALRPNLRGTPQWCFEFEVSWDEEHQRMAYLDLAGKFLAYDLSCAVVDV